MSDLYAIGYPTTTAAQSALNELLVLQTENLIQIDDAVIVDRDKNGKIKLHQPGGSNTGKGAAGGALWGGLIGLLFFAPLLGMAVGAGMGAIAGHATDTGVNDDFVRGLGDRLPAGNAALVLLVSSMTQDRVFDQLHGQFGGEILQTSLSKDEEAAVREVAERVHAAH